MSAGPSLAECIAKWDDGIRTDPLWEPVFMDAETEQAWHDLDEMLREWRAARASKHGRTEST